MAQWTALAKLIDDPLLIFLLCFYGLLAWVIFSLLRTISAQIKYERDFVAELNRFTETVVRLTTLIETLVHGRRGSKDD